MRGRNVLGCVVGMCWDAWQECAGMRGGNVLQNACQKNGKLLGCVAGMCCEMRARKTGGGCGKSVTLSLSKCVPEKRETAGMRGGKGLGCVAGMCCKMRARKTG